MGSVSSSCRTAAGSARPCPPRSCAALAVRLNGIARGGSGAGVAVAQILAAMLNAGVHPVVPETASVGAADVAQMAGMAQVAIGKGRAEYRGEVLPGGEALRRAGIAPLVLGGKDGLALISANGVSVGHAALVVARATWVAEAADVAANSSPTPSMTRSPAGTARTCRSSPSPAAGACAIRTRTARFKVTARLPLDNAAGEPATPAEPAKDGMP